MRSGLTRRLSRACRDLITGLRDTGRWSAVECVGLLAAVLVLAYLAFLALTVPRHEAAALVSSPDTWLRAAPLGVMLLVVAVAVHFRRRRTREQAVAVEHRLPRALHAGYVEKRQQILHILTGHTRRRPGECVTVRQLMTTKPATVTVSTPVAKLSQMMQDIRIRHLVVVKGEQELLGIVSDRDVAQREGRTAADIMTRKPAIVTPDTPAVQAISAMLAGRFSYVPVVDAGKLVGVLTTSDLMMALHCTLQLLAQLGESSFQEAAPVGARG